MWIDVVITRNQNIIKYLLNVLRITKWNFTSNEKKNIKTLYLSFSNIECTNSYVQNLLLIGGVKKRGK